MAAPCAPWHCVRGPVRKCGRGRPFNGIVSQRLATGVQFCTWAPSRNLSFLSRASPPRNSRSSGSGSRTSTPKFGTDKFNLTRQRGNLTASSTNRWPTIGQTRPGRFEAHGVRSVLGALRRVAEGSAIARGQEFPTSQVRSAAPSLHFKRLGKVWSVRVGDHHRARVCSWCAGRCAMVSVAGRSTQSSAVPTESPSKILMRTAREGGR